MRVSLPDFIHGLAAEAVPVEALHMARRCLLDTLAIWVAGSRTEASRVARNHAARRYPGALPLPLDGRRVNPVGYAFAGGASIDALDGHDGHQLCKGHASVAAVPTLFAEIGERDCSLDTLLCDLIVGEEIAIRAGLALHGTAADYHSSGAWNALGSAAIACRLRGLAPDPTAHALGIAEYYGPRAPMMRCIDHPTMVKDSSSWGALVGVSAADLAEDGFTGAPAVTCSGPEVAEIWADLGERWRILETNFKAYPVCRWAQPPVEAVLSMLRAQGIAPGDVVGIEIVTFHEATRLDTRRPTDGDAAQYSLPLAMALALLHGTILPEHLLQQRFDHPEVWRLVDCVRFAESERFNAVFPAERYAEVTLVLSDGRRLRSGEAVARGNHDNPLSDGELLEKLDRYLAPILNAEARHGLASILAEPGCALGFSDLRAALQVRAM